LRIIQDGGAAALIPEQFPTFPIFPPQFIEALRSWLNSNALKVPIKEFPADLTRSGPRTLVDMLEFLSGRKVPESKEASTGIRETVSHRGHRSIRQAASAVEFLRASGALLGRVHPEHLLTFEEFVKAKSISDSASLEAVTRVFPAVSMQAWVAVVCQAIRVFSLGRVTFRALRTTPGVPDITSKSEAVLLKGSPWPTSETLLLRWVGLHCQKVFGSVPAGFAFGAETFTPRTFAALLLSHVPSLERVR
jgi:hypothetical protein